METEEIIEILTEAIEKCAKEDGWANLAEVGVILREKAVSYGKLSLFIARFSGFIETKIDESKQPPVIYARFIEE